jgi:hypothetical protein
MNKQNGVVCLMQAAELATWQASLAEVKGWIQAANKEFGSDVRVGAVAMDSEQFAYSPTTDPPSVKSAVRRKNVSELLLRCLRFYLTCPLTSHARFDSGMVLPKQASY